MEFMGKVVVVTGGAKGIGREIVLAYASNGAQVFIIDKDASSGQQTRDLIGENCSFIQVDVTEQSHIKNFMQRIKKEAGRLDILINNAGISVKKPIWDLDVQDWDLVINTNLRSVFLCSREAALIMRENGGGAIVNIASTRAMMSEPNSEAYAASKGGIIALTHALAASLSKYHIQVNAISPGWIETRDYSALREIDHQQHFSHRVGRPDDVARACLFLTNRSNNFVNGENLIIDGGMTKKMIYE